MSIIIPYFCSFVHFFRNAPDGNESIFTLHDGNRKITMSLVGAAKKTAGAVTNTAPESGDATQLQKLMTLNKLTSKILYADILDGVDLEYVRDGGNVKENISISFSVFMESRFCSSK